MPLTLPNLDDRRWTELAEEGRALIPFYAPEWTDHNVHDPGITLLELFAWLAEMDVYQLNRVTQRNKLKFLSMVNVSPDHPRPSLTVLAVTPKSGETVVIPPSVEFEGKDPSGHIARFCTLTETTVVSAELKSVAREDREGLHDLTNRWRRNETLLPFGDDPQAGAVFYLGFDKALPIGVRVSLFFVVGGLPEGETERRRIVEENAARKIACSRPDPCKAKQVTDSLKDAGGTPAILPHHSATVIWEYFDSSGRWRELESESGQMADETRAFTLNGRVLITLASPMAPTKIGDAEAGYYLRCRFVSGQFDAAPQLDAVVINGVLAEQSVATGRRLVIQTSSGNLELEVEDLGEGTGRPNQRFSFAKPSALAPGFRFFTLEDGFWMEWSLRPDFDASGRADADFLLDSVGGFVIVGDGENGRTVPKGSRVIAAYRSTDADAGNLPAGVITGLAATQHNRDLPGFQFDVVQAQLAVVTSPIPSRGGAPAEPFAHAAGRAFESIQLTERAVNLDDFTRLAHQTPGVLLARASARANLHIAFPCINAPGLITVIILPHLPKGRPAPSRGLLREVAAYLNRRRVLGTRTEVVGPTYREVAVAARVQSRPGTNRAELQMRVTAAIDQFFDPLTGGPKGEGWPFGRDVYRSEVLQTIDETLGVDSVLSLELLNDGQTHCANICLGATELVASGNHHIEIV